PVAPKRVPMLLAVLLAGLGVGGALAYLLNQVRPVYQNVRTLGAPTGLPVLGYVSRTLLDSQRSAIARARVAFGAVVVMLVVVCGAVVVFSDSVVGLTQRLLGQA